MMSFVNVEMKSNNPSDLILDFSAVSPQETTEILLSKWTSENQAAEGEKKTIVSIVTSTLSSPSLKGNGAIILDTGDF
jgi:hypothetical protein